jgi:hypothetical protein
VQAGESYTVSFCNNGGAATWDTQITVFDETNTEVASNDDSCGLQSEVTFSALGTAAYTVQINQFFCTTGTTPGDVAVTWNNPPATPAACVTCADVCVELSMTDSFGDGWNGNTYTIADETGTVVATGDLDTAEQGDGSSTGLDGFCLAQGCYTITVGGGSFAGEVGWTLTGVDGGPVSGGAGAAGSEVVVAFTVDGGVCPAGCTNPIACNFDPLAIQEDGTCEFTSCAGCTDATACNFDATATLDDGSCDFSCIGCTDPAACNFDAAHTVEDGSCCFDLCASLVVTGGGFPTEVSWELVDGAGIVVASGGPGTFELCVVDGCYNFNMFDSFGDGWNGATYTFSGAITGTGDLDTATTGDGSSFGSEVAQAGTGCIPGCTDATACNFDATADFDNGSCEFTSCAGCTDPLATNFDPSATIDDGSCVFCAPGELLATIDMTDSFGDGWNGASYTIQDINTGTVIASGDLDTAAQGDGSSVGTDSFCLATGCYTYSVGGGTFDGEIGYTLSDALGNVYGSGGAVTGANLDFGLTGNCAFEGCTDANAINFDPSATIDDGSCILPPANNNVCDAEAVTCGSSVAGTTINASDNDGFIGTSCGGVTVDSPGVWYIYNAAADEQVIASLCNSLGGDSKIHVYVAAPDCNNLVCVGSNDDSCGLLSEIAFNATTGNDYYIQVSQFGTFGTGIDFTLDITCQPCDGVPANDDCVDAIPLPTNGTPVTGSLCCSSPSDAPNFSAGFATAYDVFYTVNTGTFDDLFFEANNLTGSDVGIMVYTGACGTLVDQVGGIATGTIAGTLSQFAPFQPFPQNTDITFAVFTTDPAGCGDFDITVEGLILGCTDAAANNFDPLANEDDGSCDYAGVVPPNDLCADAIAVSCNTVTDGSTGGSTATGTSGGFTGCDATPGAGVWYSFVGTGELTNINTCGSVIDSKFSVLEGPCGGPYTCVAFSDASFEDCGFFEQDDASVTFISTLGTNYLIYVGAEDIDGDPITDDNGAFTLDISCEPVVEGCTNPAAYNFDATANVEDGSCDFFSQTCAGGPGTPLQLNMFDSFGDGWNGATYTIEDGLGNVVATGDLDGAVFSVDEDNFQGPESGFDLLCLQDGCYNIIVGGGTFDGEVTFNLTDELGGIVVSGGAGTFSFTIGAAVCGCTDSTACNFDPAATDDDGSCEFVTCAGCTDSTACNFDSTATIDDGTCCFDNCVTVDMVDSFGDGWNGFVYEIYTIDGVLVATGDLDTAQSGDGASNGQDVLCLTDGCYYITVEGGAFAGEVSWTLFGVNGGPVSGGAPVTAADLLTFSVGTGACVVGCVEPVACNFDPAANIADCDACEYASCLGCTYPDATNFDPLAGASIDDGSCLFDTSNPCPTDINEDGITNSADLLQFLGAFGTTCTP